MGFIGAEYPEIPALAVQFQNIPDECAQFNHILRVYGTGVGHVQRVVPEIGHPQVPEEQTAVGVGVQTHAPGALGNKVHHVVFRGTVFVKQLLGAVAFQPVFQQMQMLLVGNLNGHLMGAEGTLDFLAVHHFRTGPALGGTQHNHGPTGTLVHALFPGAALIFQNFRDAGVQSLGHFRVHFCRVAALYKIGGPAAAPEELLQLFVGNAGQNRGVGDFKSVQMENGQHGAVGFRVQKLIQLPGSGQRSGFRLAVTHHAGGNQTGVIRHGTECVGQAVAQLTALVDGTRRFRRHMAGDAAGERELLEQFLHALFVSGDVGIHLGVGAVQPILRHHGIAAVTGTGKVNHIQIIFFDDPVQMGINEVLAGYGAPVAHNFLFDIVHGQLFPEQGIAQQVQLPGGKIVRCPPIGVHVLQGFSGNGGMLCHRESSFFVHSTYLIRYIQVIPATLYYAIFFTISTHFV